MPDSIEQLLTDGQHRLSSISASARLDCEILLEHCTGYSRAELITQYQQSLSSKQCRCFNELLNRRYSGEPIAYLVGHKEFWSLNIKVSPAVLIPRPETEHLVEEALDLIPVDACWRIADLGTGSGAIALAVASERPQCRIIAIDACAKAIALAKTNARELKIENIDFRTSDWCQAINQSCHLIISNPPYIEQADPHLTQGDVRFEPKQALVSGEDGLDDIQIIIKSARHKLLAGGWLLIEHGYNQAVAVNALFLGAGYQYIRCIPDIEQRDRLTKGRRRIEG